MSSTRSTIAPPVFANNALTVIPPTPVAGVSYRDTAAGPASSADGWPYAERVNSAEWNQLVYQWSTLLSTMDSKGILGWSNLVNYTTPAITFGSNGLFYLALQASGPSTSVQDPVSAPLYWEPLARHGSLQFSTVGLTNWPVPLAMQLGLIRPKVSLAGGGGGGGGATSSLGAAGGAGGAGCTTVKTLDLTGISNVAITLATGGAGGLGNNTGVAGGVSSFGSLLSSGGGSGGPASTGSSTFSGSGSITSSGGDYFIPGGAGRFSLVTTGLASAGVGGDSAYGKGVAAPNVTGTSVSAINGVAGSNGAGGSGAAVYNATANGGAGGNGFCLIEW